MITHLKRYYLYYIILLGLLVSSLFLEKEVEYIIWAFTSFLTLILLFTYDRIRFYGKIKALQQEKLIAELDLLKSQINPHFFFNTLNNLYGLTIKNSKKAPEVILKLSDMMRYTIYKGKQGFVTLEEELNYIESFISLQKVRLLKDSKIIFTKQIENPKCRITPLLFIIIVENAFKHGSEKLGKNAFVNINFKEDNTAICLDVTNSFLPEEKNVEGIGLSNLKRRLSLIYPNKHEFTIDVKENIYRTTLKIFK